MRSIARRTAVGAALLLGHASSRMDFWAGVGNSENKVGYWCSFLGY